MEAHGQCVGTLTQALTHSLTHAAHSPCTHAQTYSLGDGYTPKPPHAHLLLITLAGSLTRSAACYRRMYSRACIICVSRWYVSPAHVVTGGTAARAWLVATLRGRATCAGRDRGDRPRVSGLPTGVGALCVARSAMAVRWVVPAEQHGRADGVWGADEHGQRCVVRQPLRQARVSGAHNQALRPVAGRAHRGGAARRLGPRGWVPGRHAAADAPAGQCDARRKSVAARLAVSLHAPADPPRRARRRELFRHCTTHREHATAHARAVAALTTTPSCPRLCPRRRSPLPASLAT